MKEKTIVNWGYRLFKPILSPIFKFYYNPKVVNKDYIPKKGPIIFVGNHKHIMDQCLVIISTNRIVHYMAKKEYFDSIFSFFFKICGCIPVNRKIHDKRAKSLAKKVLDDKRALGIFPEGTRNKTKKLLLDFKFGAVSLAKKTNALLVPFGITGDYKFRSTNLKITFGKPFSVTDMDLEDANEMLYKKIKEILINN